MRRYFGRADVSVIPHGVDAAHFSRANRDALRTEARRRLGYASEDVVLLLVGNDFRNKGLPVLLQAVNLCPDLPLRICVVGDDASGSALKAVAQAQLRGRITFVGVTADILTFYSVADVYTAPSLEDSFNLPALEAMACGLPVVVSMSAGISEFIRNEANGLLLRNPSDPVELAHAIRRVVSDSRLVESMTAMAVKTACSLSWERHGESVLQLLKDRVTGGDRSGNPRSLRR
jgi:UDP-glucose:(heptosyl)LPS alpha-1,3-glucosyltransferase